MILIVYMNVAWYTHLYSHATGALFRQIGLDGQYMKEHHAGSFALEAHIRYLSECLLGHHVHLRARALARTKTRFHYMLFLLNDDKQVVSSTCEFVGAHIDMKVRRMSAIPPHIAAAYDELVAQHDQLEWDPPLCGSMDP